MSDWYTWAAIGVLAGWLISDLWGLVKGFRRPSPSHKPTPTWRDWTAGYRTPARRPSEPSRPPWWRRTWGAVPWRRVARGAAYGWAALVVAGVHVGTWVLAVTTAGSPANGFAWIVLLVVHAVSGAVACVWAAGNREDT